MITIAKFTFQITGTKVLSNALNDRTKLTAIKQAIKMNGSEMQQSAVRFAPYDTGYLARSIELYIQDNGLTAMIKPLAHYGVYQELGTRYQAGKPYIRPAFHRQSAIFKNDMSRFGK